MITKQSLVISQLARITTLVFSTLWLALCTFCASCRCSSTFCPLLLCSKVRNLFLWEKEPLTCMIFGFTPPPRWSPKFQSCYLYPLCLLLPFTHQLVSKTVLQSSQNSTWFSHWWSRQQPLWDTSFPLLSILRLLLSLLHPSWTCLSPYLVVTWLTWTLSSMNTHRYSLNGFNIFRL